MKFISLIFFAATMTATWMATHGKRAVEESVHVGIQNDLKRIITEYVQAKLPEAKNLVFDKFYTQTVSKNQVIAHFGYGFDNAAGGDAARIQIEGSATLNKIGETAENSTWNLDQLRILNNKVDFSEPIQITAGPVTDEKPAPPKDTH